MKKTFTKKYNKLPSEAINRVVKKYKLINDSNISDKIEVIVPEVVSHKEKSVTFECLPVEKMDSLGKHMKEETPVSVEESMEKAGVALAHIHDVLQPEKMVHGDFSPNNIFLLGDSLVVIDFEPMNADNWRGGVYNVPEHDLAHFIVSGETRFPHGNLLNYPLNRSVWYQSFLNGYQEAGGQFNKEDLSIRIREGFRKNAVSVLQDGRRSVLNKVGTIGFRGMTWIANPMLRKGL